MSRTTKTKETGEKNKDKSPYVSKDKPKLNFDLAIRENIPWTKKQKELFALIQNKDTKVVFIKGNAGTSKSISAIYTALQELNQKKVNEIIYVRSAVESSDQKLGMLPGKIESKMEPYLAPMLDKANELLSQDQVKGLIAGGFLTGIPVSFLRGRHFANKFIIMDETQCSTFREIETLISRAGEFTKILLLADPSQSDLPRSKQGGFEKMFSIFNDEESRKQGIHSFEFTTDDIVRSKLVKFIVEKIEKSKEPSPEEGDWRPGEKETI